MSFQKYQFIQEDLKNLFSKVQVQGLESLKNSQVCITGGSGFIGTWLCEIINYLNENHKFQTRVHVIDRDIEKIKKNVPHFLDSQLFTFQMADVKNILELPKDVNYIVHAAGQPDSRYHLSNPVDTMNSIAQGADALLRCTERLTHLKMFLTMSSSLVYGSFFDRVENTSETDQLPIDEASISNVYAAAKKFSETQTIAYKNQFRVPVTILRPFTFMGPYQSLQGPWALNNFINDMINKKSIKVLGDGETVRSFLYASDAAYWILSALVNAESGSIYNLGSQQATSLKELASLVGAYRMDSAHEGVSEIIYCAGTGTSLKKSRMVPNVEKLTRKFGLKQTVPLQQAVERTIQWHLLNS